MSVGVVCAYAPTARAPPGMKSRSLSDLRDTLDKAPQNDVLVLLGDFNARVGVLKLGEEECQGVVGKHGLDERNEAGEVFMQFCALNQLTVMNTWFQKKSIHYVTWMYTATDRRQLVGVVLLDISNKAFDTVNHNLLLAKLSKLRFSLSAIAWFE